MSYDEEFARAFARDEDRDSAGEFFVGRERELEILAYAVERAADRPQAAFRVFQGAPGAGKSALLGETTRRHECDLGTLFVRLSNAHLRDREALADWIAETATKRLSKAGKAAGVAAEAVGGYFRAGTAANRVGRFLAQRGIKRVVLCLDEAQTVDESCAEGLRELHTNGIGRPAVVALFGLSHTAGRVRSLGGLSRLSRQAVANLGELAEDECAESTRRLLDRIGPRGDRGRAARFVAELSLGWPQHLKCAQSATCDELVRARGNLDRMDFERVRDETDAERAAYYEGRLENSELGVAVAFTASIVAEAKRRGRVERGELAAICGRMLPAARTDYPELADVSGAKFARLLVEKGVLSHAADGGFEPTIPSMADWLEAKAGRSPDRPPPDRSRGFGR